MEPDAIKTAVETRKYSRYPDHIHAAAYNYLDQGYSLRAIERNLAQDFPDQLIPAFNTIAIWEQERNATAQSTRVPRMERIIDLADDAVAQGLRDVLAGNQSLAAKSLIAANAAGNTLRDKLYRDANPAMSTLELAIESAEGTLRARLGLKH